MGEDRRAAAPRAAAGVRRIVVPEGELVDLTEALASGDLIEIHAPAGGGGGPVPAAEERGYRKAIADLRAQSDKTSVDAGTPAIWVAFASAADWLESRLTEGPNSPGVWALPPEPGPEVKAVRTGAGRIWYRDDPHFWTSGNEQCSWEYLFRNGAPLTEVVDTDG